MVECRHPHFWIANSAVYRTPPCTALENATPANDKFITSLNLIELIIVYLKLHKREWKKKYVSILFLDHLHCIYYYYIYGANTLCPAFKTLIVFQNITFFPYFTNSCLVKKLDCFLQVR